MTAMFRSLIAAAALLTLAACDAERDLADPVVPLGDMRLGHIVVKTDEVQKVGPSKDVSPELWQESMEAALKKRFGRFEGETYYHIGVVVRGYYVAGAVPVTKSTLIVDVTVFDNEANKLEPEPRQFAVLESFGTGGPLGGALTMTKNQQVQQLTANAAKRIESWMRENEAFFTPTPGEG